MTRKILVFLFLVLFLFGHMDGKPILTRSAAAAFVVDVASRKAALEGLPRSELRRMCRGSTTPPRWFRTAIIADPNREQGSNVANASDALFDNIAAYYGDYFLAAEAIRDALAEGVKIRAFTELVPRASHAVSSHNTMNAPVFEVASFLVPLAHAYLILKEEYPDEGWLLSSVKRWGDELYRVTRDGGTIYDGEAEGLARRASVAAGWAHWGNAADNRDALASAKRYYKYSLHAFGPGGIDRFWRRSGKRAISDANALVSAALVAAYALRRSGEEDVYSIAPRGGTVVAGAARLWNQLHSGSPLTETLRSRSLGRRQVEGAWIELFVREFPTYPGTLQMRSWISRAGRALYGDLAGGPTTCLYRRV